LSPLRKLTLLQEKSLN